MRSVNFSNDNLAVQWQYVKRNLGEFGISYQFNDFELQAHDVIQKLIQSCVNEEFALQVKAGRYEHAPNRLDERQGTYERNLTTTFGTSKILVPRIRFKKVKIHYSLFEKYQRRQKKFDKMIVLAMLLGLSVRKQRRFFKSFIGDAVSHTTASKLIRTLEEGLQGYRTRPIEDKYKYLLLDGLWVKVKDAGKLKEKVILFILGVTLDNKKEIIAFKLAGGETEEEVTALLNDIYRRGLEGKQLKLIASDGAKGIRSAINMVYPYAKWQLCYVHKIRNLNKHIRHKINNRPGIMRQIRAIYKSKNKQQAIERFDKFCAFWQEYEPYAIKCFKDGFYDTLHYFEFMEDKNLISSTNHIERELEEVRRRIKIQGYFKSDRSANLWVYGIISQVMQEQQPDVLPRHVTIFREPKYESVQ
ncbi:MAG: IS256 family transposase [Candidatus Omnitrophota bacterium]|nr:IS256 family transposase [Candidatus Omnitrophota bacterium]